MKYLVKGLIWFVCLLVCGALSNLVRNSDALLSIAATGYDADILKYSGLVGLLIVLIYAVCLFAARKLCSKYDEHVLSNKHADALNNSFIAPLLTYLDNTAACTPIIYVYIERKGDEDWSVRLDKQIDRCLKAISGSHQYRDNWHLVFHDSVFPATQNKALTGFAEMVNAVHSNRRSVVIIPSLEEFQIACKDVGHFAQAMSEHSCRIFALDCGFVDELSASKLEPATQMHVSSQGAEGESPATSQATVVSINMSVHGGAGQGTTCVTTAPATGTTSAEASGNSSNHRTFRSKDDEIIKYWGALYSVKTMDSLPEQLKKGLQDGIWSMMEQEKGPDFSNSVRAFIDSVNEDQLAKILNIKERFENGEFVLGDPNAEGDFGN